MDSKGFERHIAEPNGPRAVVVEDDGRAAYAYLILDGDLSGDVWLYNVGVDPETVNFKDQDEMPFPNPGRFCASPRLPRLLETSQLHCDWDARGVLLSVDGVPWARLEAGSKPGWSRGAAIAGPLAKPMEPK